MKSKHQKSTAKQTKALWHRAKKAGCAGNLRRFVYDIIGARTGIDRVAPEALLVTDIDVSNAKTWLHNKQANPSNGPLGIGNTKKRGSKSGAKAKTKTT